jgi:transposase
MPREVNEPSWVSIRRSRRWSATEGRWVLAELERSGLSAKEFAERHRVPVTRVYQWCCRLRGKGKRRASAARATPRLVEVELPAARGSAPGTDRIEIELLNGRRLSVPEGLSLDRVSALVTILERR